LIFKGLCYFHVASFHRLSWTIGGFWKVINSSVMPHSWCLLCICTLGFMMKLMVGHSVRDTHRVISAFVYCHVELTERLPSKSHRFVFHWLV
jgi:surface polysaccharide O-acyltransferase-like enzyme